MVLQFLLPAALNLAGNIWAGNEQANAERQAASTTVGGYDNATNTLNKYLPKTEEQYASAAAQYNPYATAGTTALDSYQKALSQAPGFDIENSPVYQYQKKLIEKNLGNQLAAQGKGRSGKAIEGYYTPAYAQLGANEYQNQYSRYRDYLGDLGGLVNTGYNASGNIANLNRGQADMYSQFASNMGNLQIARANAEAGGGRAASAAQTGGFTRGLSGALGTIGQGMYNEQFMNFLNPSQPGSSASPSMLNPNLNPFPSALAPRNLSNVGAMALTSSMNPYDESYSGLGGQRLRSGYY